MSGDVFCTLVLWGLQKNDIKMKICDETKVNPILIAAKIQN